MKPLSRLDGHPDRTKVPGVETNTGRSATACRSRSAWRSSAQLTDALRRTFALTGDGELQEGSMWEAAMAAGHFGLDNLDRDRRPQRPPAGRLHRVDDPPRAARRQVDGVRLGRPRGRRPRPRGSCSTTFRRGPVRAGPPEPRDRAHPQGQRRLASCSDRSRGTTRSPTPTSRGRRASSGELPEAGVHDARPAAPARLRLPRRLHRDAPASSPARIPGSSPSSTTPSARPSSASSQASSRTASSTSGIAEQNLVSSAPDSPTAGGSRSSAAPRRS